MSDNQTKSEPVPCSDPLLWLWGQLCAFGSTWIFPCQPQSCIKTQGHLMLTGRTGSLVANVCTDFFLPVEAKLGNGLQLIFVALIKEPWQHFLAGLWGDGCVAPGNEVLSFF